jgi:hypothetical protein
MPSGVFSQDLPALLSTGLPAEYVKEVPEVHLRSLFLNVIKEAKGKQIVIMDDVQCLPTTQDQQLTTDSKKLLASFIAAAAEKRFKLVFLASEAWMASELSTGAAFSHSGTLLISCLQRSVKCTVHGCGLEQGPCSAELVCLVRSSGLYIDLRIDEKLVEEFMRSRLSLSLFNRQNLRTEKVLVAKLYLFLLVTCLNLSSVLLPLS